LGFIWNCLHQLLTVPYCLCLHRPLAVGTSCNDAYASDSGDNWMELLKSVEEKLRRQLMKIDR